MSDKTIKEEFQIKEFEKLNVEIAAHMDDIRAREKYSVTIFAAIATFIFTFQIPANVKFWAAFLPVTCTTLMGLTVLGIYLRIGRMGGYLRQLEIAVYGKESSFGWEKFDEKRSLLGVFSFIFWAAQIIAGIAFVCIMHANKEDIRTKNKPIQIMSIEGVGQSIDTVIIHSHSSKK